MGVLPDEPLFESSTPRHAETAEEKDNFGADEWPYYPRLTDYGSQGHLTMRGIKLFADGMVPSLPFTILYCLCSLGALGSFGAALLEPYSDHPSTSGLMRTPPQLLRSQIERLYE